MNEAQRAILQEVAEGRLSPEEAAALLDRGRWNRRMSSPEDFAGGGHSRRPPRGPRPGRWWAGEETWEREPWGRGELTVRMRPDLPLEVDLSAGQLRTDGMTGPLRFDVRAGSARI